MGCLFVYGLVSTNCSMDEGEELRQTLAEALAVEPGEAVRLLEVGRLGVLVSAVPLDQYSEPYLERNLEDVAWLEPRARAHAEVITRAFTCQPVLPMRFGILFSTKERLAEALKPMEDDLMAVLAAAEGREEWTVRLCANPEALLERMAAETQAESEKAGRGAQYLLRRRLCLQGRPEMTARLLGLAEEGHAALARLALHVSAVRTEVTGLPGGQRSLLSRVYEIAQPRREEFLTELERVGERLGPEGFSTVHSGPWPAARVSGIG